MAHSYSQLYYHIVFSTKDRQPTLTDNIRPRLFPYIGGIIRDHGGTALIVNGVSDHIHILAQLKPDITISDMIRDIKAHSTGWLHKTILSTQHFTWQAGHATFSVSQSQIDKVRKYIANQEEHHRRYTWEEEFKKLLIAHGISFDDRYLWT